MYVWPKRNIQAQHVTNKSMVSKLSYQVKGPFVITKDIGKCSFKMKLYDSPHSTSRKYNIIEPYISPPRIIPFTAIWLK